MIALYHLFCTLSGVQRPRHREVIERYASDFKAVTIEEMAVRLTTEDELPWTIAEIEKLHDAYHLQRHHKTTLRMGDLLDAMFTLRLAEEQRKAGNQTRARELVVFAFEAFPGFPGLRAFEASLSNDGQIEPISARDILLPPCAKPSAIGD